MLSLRCFHVKLFLRAIEQVFTGPLKILGLLVFSRLNRWSEPCSRVHAMRSILTCAAMVKFTKKRQAFFLPLASCKSWSVIVDIDGIVSGSKVLLRLSSLVVSMCSRIGHRWQEHTHNSCVNSMQQFFMMPIFA